MENEPNDLCPTIPLISMFSGCCGIELGIERCLPNLRCVAYVEREAWAVWNIVSKIEAGLLADAPIFTDVRDFPWDEHTPYMAEGMLTGGFPCQPSSSAGKRQADSDHRWLFPAVVTGISECQPACVFLENVDGLISATLLGDSWADPAGTPLLLHVMRELERVGYPGTFCVVSSSEVGATHIRKRVFILAFRADLLADSSGAGMEKYRPADCGDAPYGGRPWIFLAGGGGAVRADRPLPPGPDQWAWEPDRTIPTVDKLADTRSPQLGGVPSERREGLPEAGNCGAGPTVADAECNQPERGGASGDVVSQAGSPTEERNQREWLRNTSGHGGSTMADTYGSSLRQESPNGDHGVRIVAGRPQAPGQSGDGCAPGLADPSGGRLREGNDSGLPESSDEGRRLLDVNIGGGPVVHTSGIGEGAEKLSGSACLPILPGEGVAESQGLRRGEGGPNMAGEHGGHDVAVSRECALADTVRVHGRSGNDEVRGRRGVRESGEGSLGKGTPIGPVDGSPDGHSDRLDSTQLHGSHDSRVDELRLIGNGVDPDVAEHAYRILWNRFADAFKVTPRSES